MPVSFTAIQSKMEEAVAALESGDFATAKTKATVAHGLVTVLPNAESRSQVGGSFEWNPDAIDKFIARVEKLEREQLAQNNGVFRMPIKYQPADSDCDY